MLYAHHLVVQELRLVEIYAKFVLGFLRLEASGGDLLNVPGKDYVIFEISHLSVPGLLTSKCFLVLLPCIVSAPGEG